MGFGYESRLLKRSGGSCEVNVLRGWVVPVEVGEAVEQTTGGRATFRKIVMSRAIYLALPEVGIAFRDETVVYAGKLARDRRIVDGKRFDAGVGLRLRIEDPAKGR